MDTRNRGSRRLRAAAQSADASGGQLMESLRSTTIYSEPNLSVAAVEFVAIRQCRTTAGGLFFGRSEPVAIVIQTPERTYAIDMAGNPTSIDLEVIRLACVATEK